MAYSFLWYFGGKKRQCETAIRFIDCNRIAKESPLDEGGAAGAYILKFVRANDLHNK